MDFMYRSQGLSEVESKAIEAWLRKFLPEVMAESDEVFIEYVTVMIANQKTMPEIAKELVDLMGEVKASELATQLGSQLKRIVARSIANAPPSGKARVEVESKDESAGVANIISTSARSSTRSVEMGPLKTSRESGGASSKRDSGEVGTSLVSGAKKSRGDSQVGFESGTRRRVIAASNASDNSSNYRSNNGSNAYNEIVQLAQASGFSSPAEMLVMQQQQLMTLMQGMQTVASMQQFNTGHYRGGGYMGRGGRGARGGRGGAYFPHSGPVAAPTPYIAPTHAPQVSTSAAPLQALSNPRSESIVPPTRAATGEEYVPRGGRFGAWRGGGRESYRGGGRGFRGAVWRGGVGGRAVSQNKKWVRTEETSAATATAAESSAAQS